MKTYKVNSLKKKEIIISGKGRHPLWKEANSLTDFSSPWDAKTIDKIEFKALHNLEKIFFLFQVHDSQTHIHPSKNKNESINNSDRVELFFRTNKQLNPYFCLEIDPTSRLMDFMAKPNKVFDFNWQWPKNGVIIKSDIQNDFFTVEVSISLDSLIQLGLLKDGKIEAGIYRAKYNLQDNGSFKPTWITWVNPNTKIPNFHTPASFGIMNLEVL